jgi:aldehyde:ferredoxin oxidoreductase
MSDRGGVHLYGTTIEGQDNFAIADGLTLCIRNVRYLGPETINHALTAATGWQYFTSQDEWNQYAQRIIILERAWNIKHGLLPERDDILPERVFTEPLTQGPKAGTPAVLYDRQQFEKDKQAWYAARGCDSRGIPTRTTLINLELDFVIPELSRVVDLST